MRIGLNAPQDFLALLVRRKWWVVAPFLALTCGVALMTYVLPRTYVSEVLILVQPRDVPKDFVKDLIASSPEERLRAIEQTILSRTNLVQILREFGDSLPEFKPLNMDDRVAKLRGKINIIFEIDKNADGKALPLSYFRISYQDRSPELAQKIASKLTTLFIEKDNKTRENQVFGTTEFLTGEAEKVQQQLADSEEKLKEVKSSRQFELPDQREANLRTLERLGLDKRTNAEALDRQATLRLTLEQQLSQTPALIPKPLGPSPLVVRSPQMEDARRAQAEYEEYRKAQGEYEELASKYTEKHPEVQAAKARMERLKQKLSPDLLSAPDTAVTAATAPTETMEPNPVYQKLTAELQAANTELAIREREKVEIEAQIARYGARIENAPKAEQDIAEVARVNEELKKNYDDLKSKLSQARLAESLESKQKGSQFQIIDPANYPLAPSKPNKLAVLVGGMAASLVISMLFAAAVDIARQRVWTQSQVEACWGVPVLVDIPEIVTDVDPVAIRKKRIVYAASSLAAAAFYSVFLYAVYLKQDSILMRLDPVLQKLVYK